MRHIRSGWTLNWMSQQNQQIAHVIQANQAEILTDWIQEQTSTATWRSDLMSAAELRQQSSEFLDLFMQAVQKGNLTDITGVEWARVREMLNATSRSRALQGFSPSETATFVFSLKNSLFTRLREEFKTDSEGLATALWDTTSVLDKLGLYTTEVYQQSREAVINRQQQEMLELSTPVIKLWEGVLALPLIGTLDSERTQVIMESLLQRIVETSSPLVIIDITGVPTVDTLVAQHLIKTVAAARLMGSDCIISGIRPQIAQTIVHLGVDLHEIITKANLADAFVLALQRMGFSIIRPTNRG
jgi:rsbT co-antagonist protein RsbR